MGDLATTKGEEVTRDHAWEQVVGSPRRLILACLAVVFLVDLVISAFRPTLSPSPLRGPQSSGELGLQLASLGDGDWLMVGDSVLAGDVLASKRPGTHKLRVVDYAGQLRAGGEAQVAQVALNGVLPGDILGIVDALDQVDPEGTTKLVIELNPRFFSKEYRDETCAHEWLCARSSSGTNPWARAGRWANAQLDRMGRWVPIYRHRPHLAQPIDLVSVVEAPEDDPSTTADPLLARARLVAHYRGWKRDGKSKQVQALDALLQRVAAAEREALFFLTPINESFFAGELDAQELGRLSGWLGQRVSDVGGPTARFVDLNHPSFDAALFLDHCHLLPAGNRLLALNLLSQMGLRLDHHPGRTEQLLPRQWRPDLAWGHRDGLSGRALLERANPQGQRSRPCTLRRCDHRRYRQQQLASDPSWLNFRVHLGRQTKNES